MKEKLKEFKEIFLGKEMGIIPSGLAFSFFLALIPIISIIFFLITSLDLSADALQTFISETFSSDVNKLITPILFDKITLDSIITLFLGLVVATNGSNAIIIASNTIFNIPNKNYLKRYLKAFILSIVMILLFVFMICVPLLGNSIISLLGKFGTFIADNEFLIKVIFMAFQIPVSLFVVFFFIKILYTVAPDQKISSKYVNKGALFTTIGWLVSTIIYSFYINNIADYSLVYGNLANIVILLLWLYLLSYIFVIGLFLNKTSIEQGIEKTNIIKLDEIRKKVKEDSKKNRKEKNTQK